MVPAVVSVLVRQLCQCETCLCYWAGEYRSGRGAVLRCGGMGPAGPGQHSAGCVLWDGNHRHLSGEGDIVVCNRNLVHL